MQHIVLCSFFGQILSLTHSTFQKCSFFFFLRVLKLSIKINIFFSKKIPFRNKEVGENKGKQPVTMTHYVPYKL